MGKKSFWKKYFFTSVGFILIVVIILIAVFVNFYYREQKKIINTNADDIMYFAENSLKQRLGQIEEQIGGNGMARNFMIARQNEHDLGFKNNAYNTRSLIETIYADNNDILAIFYSDDKGNYSAGESLDFISDRLNIIKEKQESELFKINKHVWFYRKMPRNSNTCVLYREIVYIDVDYGRHKLGDILVYVDGTKMAEKYFTERQKATGVIFLDSDRIITIATKLELIGRNFDECFKVSDGMFFDGQNKKYYFTESPVSISGWKGISYFEEGYISSKLWKTIGGMLAITFLCVLVMLIVFYYITRGITRPLEELFSYIRVSDKGEIFVDDENHSNEFNEIKAIFDKIVSELKRQIHINYKSEIELKNALIKSYEYQMNPHFLYNTLQIIQMLNAIGRKDDVNYSISYLGKVLRFNLQSKNEVTLKEEMDNIQNYCAILKYRYGDKFNYKIIIDEALYSCKVIKFLLQPFVENCVNHGFRNKTDPWEIAIAAIKIRDELAIIVRDNGTGIKKELLKCIKEELREEKYSKIGIGISNVNSRIKLSYGKKYGVDIFSEENNTQAIMHIPCILADKEEDCDV